MTDQNNAAQAAARILTHLGFAQAVSMEPGADPRREHIQALIETAFPSKLRVPVADERATFEHHARACELTRDEDEPDDYRNSHVQEYWNGWKARAALASARVADSTLPLEQAMHELVNKIDPGLDTGDLLQDARRASTMLDAIMTSGVRPASAPVPGEAQKPVAWLLETTPDGYALHRSFDFEEPPTGFPGLVRKTPLYAAPQASEAVRILFPTCLRKMWSGGEVQAWLDEHQSITPPKPSAKGSLERYRKWQAEQAVARNTALEEAAALFDGGGVPVVGSAQMLVVAGRIRALKYQAEKVGSQRPQGVRDER